MSKKSVDPDNARLPEQRAVLNEINAGGYCPFCWENFERNHKEPILRKESCWLVTQNQWPYDHTDVHLLFVLKRHIETLGELHEEEVIQLFKLLSWAETHFDIPGGGVGMRFGNTEFSGGTVNHLHAQLMVPKPLTERDGFVMFPIGKK